MFWLHNRELRRAEIRIPPSLMLNQFSSGGFTALNARKSKRSYAILIPPQSTMGTLNRDGKLKKMPVNMGETDAPTERAIAVTPAAAERSSGATTAIVYD